MLIRIDVSVSFPDGRCVAAPTPAELPHRRPDITHRTPALGRCRPHRALLRQYARKDRYRDLRQSRSK
jgi:hypothetical protein